MVPLEEEPDPELIFQSDKFRFDLVVMERAVLENIYQPELAAYRQLAALQGNTRLHCIWERLFTAILQKNKTRYNPWM